MQMHPGDLRVRSQADLPPPHPTRVNMGEVVAVEETFKRIQGHKGVVGVVVLNADGIAIRSGTHPGSQPLGSAPGPPAQRVAAVAAVQTAAPASCLCSPSQAAPAGTSRTQRRPHARMSRLERRSSFEPDVTVQYAALVSQFTVKARQVVRNLDAENELQVGGAGAWPCTAGLPWARSGTGSPGSSAHPARAGEAAVLRT
jgi:hypothetical protein